MTEKNHIIFVADETTDQTHVEEAQMTDSINNFSGAVTLDSTNLTN